MTSASSTAISSAGSRDKTATTVTTGFLGLLEQFMQEGLEEPDRFDQIPMGAVLVILPTDDPDLAALELARANRLAAQGHLVHVESIGPRRPTPPRWWLGERVPGSLQAWLPGAEALLMSTELTVVYDQHRDVLVVSQGGDHQHGLAWPIRSGAWVLVDSSMNHVFAFIVPDFVASSVPRLSHLDALLALATFRSLAQADVGDFALPELLSAPLRSPNQTGAMPPQDRARLIEAFSVLTGEAESANCTFTQFVRSDADPIAGLG